ncbi:hypothetical protein [Tateyamaria sp.]|uniref:hypothetical protein n=1 Tax=Tateyamaria sp. TaxID=1929288 RepID=UPI0032A05678
MTLTTFTLRDLVEPSLVGFESYHWHEPVLWACTEADKGDEKAYIEIIRTVRSSIDVPGMEKFHEIVLSQCHLVEDKRERFECARVCKDACFHQLAYENLKPLADEGYWPAQYLLGYSILSHKSYAKYDDDGHVLLRSSCGKGHQEGLLISRAFRAREAGPPWRYFLFLRAVATIPFAMFRTKCLGEPFEKSQLSPPEENET